MYDGDDAEDEAEDEDNPDEDFHVRSFSRSLIASRLSYQSMTARM